MNNYCVYKHTCPDGCCYVGITGRTPEERWKDGFGYQSSNYTFFRKIVKFGWDNIKHEILYSGLSEKEARELENLEIEKCHVHALNVTGVKTNVRGIPKNPLYVLEGLSDIEKYALDLWVGKGYDGDKVYLKYDLYKKGFIQRTVYEFESGDPVRIEKEKLYIKRNQQKELENRRRVGKTVCFNGEEKTYGEWENDSRVSVSGATIRHRIEKKGWCVEDALFTASLSKTPGSRPERIQVFESYQKV